MQTQIHSRPAGASVAGVVSLVVLIVGLLLTAADVSMAWVVWPLGYGVALPLAVGYAKRREADSRSASRRDGRQPDRLARLRDRYVRGEIDDREFEAELDRVLRETTDERP